MKTALALSLLLVAAGPMLADVSGTAFDLYAEGRYEDAVRAALTRNDAGGFALAARSALAEEMSRDKPCLSCLVQAEDYARRAIALDPKLPEAQVYLALSLGMEEHIRGPEEARRLDYPSIAKHALDEALSVDPKNVWALAALGGWNLAIVRGGGRLLAGLFYGATESRGLRAFETALADSPNNIPLRYQFALSLSMYDRERFRSQIEDALAHTQSVPASTAYDRMAQLRAGELLALIKRGDDTAYDAAVRKFEGYP